MTKELTIAPGSYTFQELLDVFGFDLDTEAVSESGSVDYRRVKVGRLGFDDLQDILLVPDTATTLDLELDGTVLKTATVKP